MSTILKGTREVLFDIAIERFATVGFENVSMRDIAKQANIKAASIYNHFISKNAMLDEIYAYFAEHFQDNQRSLDELKNIMRTGTKDELIQSLMFTFESSDQTKYRRLVLISKIIYMRMFSDEKANDLFLKLMNEDIEIYVKEILEYGVTIGRLRPFDIDIYTSFLIGQRHFMGIKAFASPSYVVKQLDEEKKITQMLSAFLPFKEDRQN